MGKRGGFTLIELLVVISIIALLLSVLMPALSKVKMQAKAVICLSNQRQWALTFSMYTQENNDRFMDGSVPEDSPYWWEEGGGGGMGSWWFLVLKPYYKEDKIRPVSERLL